MKKLIGLLSAVMLLGAAACQQQLNSDTTVSKCGEDLLLDNAGVVKKVKKEKAAEAEALKWVYDREAKQLTFLHDNLCVTCGDDYKLTMVLSDDGENGYILEEDIVDTDKNTNSKCGFCKYDLKTSAPMEGGEIKLVFKKNVDENGNNNGSATLFSGKIDLREGHGEIVIKENVVCQ